jgi:phasin family protein
MTLLSDQLTAVRQAQWEAQLDMFRKMTASALDSAGQIAALNMRTSRASVEQVTGTLKHMLEARDPRDLFALGSAAQDQLHTLFSYSRELFGLTVGGRSLPGAIPLLAAPAPTANIPVSYTQVIEQASIATNAAATITSEIAAAAVDTGAALSEAAIDAGSVARAVPEPQAAPAPEPQAAPAPELKVAPAPEPQAAPEAQAAPAEDPAAARLAEVEAAIETTVVDEVPSAEPTPVAKAVQELATKPAGAVHPAASSVALEAADAQVELPVVTPPKAARSRKK